jgi:ABC-type nitrate/sulfonate/bicarbonate transport system substrate-binding protein
MFKWPIVAAVALAVGLHPGTGRAQEIETVFAIPSQTLVFAAHYVAHDAGFFRKEGLKVTDRYLVGIASPNAVLAGAADFTIGSGVAFLRAVSQGQKFKAILNLMDKPTTELVLRKDVADAAGITAAMPMRERVKVLKGKTIAVQGIGSIVHAWQRYVTDLAGLDVDKDVRVAPMDPPAMLPALESKAIDGYASGAPFTTQAVLKGSAVMLASSTFDEPDLLPFANAMVYGRPDLCQQKRDLCARVARAYIGAARMIQEKPDEVLETVLKKRFAKMDPQLLAEAWKVSFQAHAKDLRITQLSLENTQKYNLRSKLLDPKEVVTRFDDLYTDEFLRE